ncbi:hypothetical protein [Rathayibacter sp. AY1A3]|uniref:hypothetical protein n=1 Tax=Rathayibacter sp. AY1A3 TaxID=2080521 RepID=UPI000CE8AF3D|nr:hypothetical protein [Rathayibacter sp. AY1A3]PPF40790.1 hypothetical protein C5C10_01065 [Rathayibacter sp. AY1A3]
MDETRGDFDIVSRRVLTVDPDGSIALTQDLRFREGMGLMVRTRQDPRGHEDSIADVELVRHVTIMLHR